jgi:peptidoglycan LD-endopeptidase LytH
MRLFMTRSIWVICLVLFLFGCKAGKTVFGKNSPYETYGSKLQNAGLENTLLGKAWFEAGAVALTKPTAIKTPFHQVGYFRGDKPAAVGLVFEGQRGQKLLFRLKKNPATGFVIYNEIWKKKGTETTLEVAVDTSENEFSFEVEDAGWYILRMQPELLQSGEYSISVDVGPSLGFPVAGKADIRSFWGVARDGGARKHEGIDIFAPKKAPVVAAADGVVTRVYENELGGKVVFMRPENKNLSLYYAHLDAQLVSAGQRVKLGDTLGLVGNTGNARTTPPHLHFGIYTMAGPIDPLAFVDPVVKRPRRIEISGSSLNDYFRVNKDMVAANIPLARNSIVKPVALNDQYYLVELSSGELISIGSATIQPAAVLQSLTAKDSLPVFEKPEQGSPVKKRIPPGGSYSVLGRNGKFSFVRYNVDEGWVMN